MPNQRIVIFVAGPTGSGKTTLVKKLAGKAALHIEDASLNPHLTARIGRTFNAAASQTWFLEQMAIFLNGRPDGVLVVEQHPRVVSRVYGMIFYDKGLLSRRILNRLDRQADRIWEQAEESSSRVLTVCLSASTRSLKERLRIRKSGGLTMREVSSVNRRYSSVVFPGPCLLMNTDVLNIKREVSVVDAWLSDPESLRLGSGEW